MGFGRDETQRRASDELIIFMGKGVAIKGDLHFEGSGRVDGTIEGNIKVEGTLILGEDAVIVSEIQGNNIIVGGHVRGKIIASEKVQLLKTSVVNCDIQSPSLVIDEGAQFNGRATTARFAKEAQKKAETKVSEIKKKVPMQAVK